MKTAGILVLFALVAGSLGAGERLEVVTVSHPLSIR